MSRELPSFDLVVATVGRTEELERFLDSVAVQGFERVRVIVVDQNADERVAEIVRRAPSSCTTPAGSHATRARDVARSVYPDDDFYGAPQRVAGASPTPASTAHRAAVDAALVRDLRYATTSGTAIVHDLPPAVISGSAVRRLGLGSGAVVVGREIDSIRPCVRCADR